MINKETIEKLNINTKWLTPLNNTLNKYNIKDKKEIAMFLAQTTHESNNIKDLKRASDTLLKGFLMYSKKE